MEKRPVSLTIIAWLLIVFSVLGLISMIYMTSTAAGMQKLAEMHMSPLYAQVSNVIGVIVGLLCAYGILKGQPWSRVLYVVYGIISFVVGLYMSPMKLPLVGGLILLAIFSVFLFGEKANVWFQARGFMLHRESMPG
jgi:hypothetical protein